MGFVKAVLAQSRIDERCWFSPTLLSVEMAENFHFHLRNLRLQFDTEEFEQFCESVSLAYENWKKMGKPSPKTTDKNSTALYLNSQTGLSGQTIKPVPGVFPTDMLIELQKTNGFLHWHCRNMRLDLGLQEFIETTNLFNVAMNNLEKAGMVKRSG